MSKIENAAVRVCGAAAFYSAAAGKILFMIFKAHNWLFRLSFRYRNQYFKIKDNYLWVVGKRRGETRTLNIRNELFSGHVLVLVRHLGQSIGHFQFGAGISHLHPQKAQQFNGNISEKQSERGRRGR